MEKRDNTSESFTSSDKGETIASSPITPFSGKRVESFDFLAPPDGAEGLGWLAHYRVVKLLGAGGMGLVFHAEDTQLQRSVALKVVRPEMAKDDALRQRFLREARATAAVKSDHIVTIYQVGQANDLPFLAMEFLQGESLEAWLDQGNRPDPAAVLRLGREIALGLAAAHERGLIHRDIKPANVFLEAPGHRVKILDFGLARPVREPSGLTEAGMILGTPDYMAPEQADGDKVSERSDLFSLGCLLYRLLAGETPFGGGSTMAVLKAVALKTPKPLRQVNPAVPRPLANLVMQLMAKNPAERPASAREVADELEAMIGDFPEISASTQNRQGAPSQERRVRPSRVPAVALIGLAIGLLLVLGGAYFMWQAIRGGANAGGAALDSGPRKTNPSPAVVEIDSSASGQTLNGGGSTFVYPLMDRWAAVYKKERGVKVNYVATGSGAGIQQLTSLALDFCCSDAPMSIEELKQARETGGDVQHVPLALGGIVPAYNLEGLDKPLRFSGAVLADIFLGDVKKWNDPALKDLNPGVALPDQEITVIHRADSSGSTYIFTDFLSKVSKPWQSKIGTGAAVKWPVGVAAKGNEGMVEAMLKRPGAIAYVELLYALRAGMKFGAVKNRDGSYLQGSLETVTAAAEGVLQDTPTDLRLSLTYAPGKDAYPICGCTWAILYVKQPEGKGQRLVDFLRWATHDG